MSQYKWEEIKAKYETGKYSMKELAQEYGFNPSYGARKARNDNWVKGKSTKEVQDKATKKILEEEADKEARLRKEYEQMLDATVKGAFKVLMDEQDFNRLKQFKIFSQILHNCRKEHWEVNEILDIADKKMTENQDEALDRFLEGIENMPVVE